MEGNRLTLLGASRSAMWCIGQAAQRRRWADFPHLETRHRVETSCKQAVRFCPLTALTRVRGGIAPRHTVRLVSNQNRYGQMIPSKQEWL